MKFTLQLTVSTPDDEMMTPGKFGEHVIERLEGWEQLANDRRLEMAVEAISCKTAVQKTPEFVTGAEKRRYEGHMAEKKNQGSTVAQFGDFPSDTKGKIKT